MRLFRFLRAIRSDVRGTALIEGAIMLPVLFVLFFGVFEFSWYFYEQHRVTTGIRDAARYIARSDLVSDLGDVLTNAKNLATTYKDDFGNVKQRVRGWTASDVQIVFDPTTSPPCPPGTYCAVQVSTSFTPVNLGFLGFLRLNPFTITVSHYERFVGDAS